MRDSTADHAPAGYRLRGSQFDEGANALIMLHRVAFFDDRKGKLDDTGQRALLRWAAEHRLGQQDDLVRLVSALAGRRRSRACAPGACMTADCVPCRNGGWPWAWADKSNAHEIGLSMHGTYGWPVIPGSSMKGLAAAWAAAAAERRRQRAADPAAAARHAGCGLPARRHGPEAGAGHGVLPGRDPGGPAGRGRRSTCSRPHVKPVLRRRPRPAPASPSVPPAEYHNPVPVNFLTVGGAFAVDLYGADEDDVSLAADWLIEGGDELGAGAKTAAGYGYLR